MGKGARVGHAGQPPGTFQQIGRGITAGGMSRAADISPGTTAGQGAGLTPELPESAPDQATAGPHRITSAATPFARKPGTAIP